LPTADIVDTIISVIIINTITINDNNITISTLKLYRAYYHSTQSQENKTKYCNEQNKI